MREYRVNLAEAYQKMEPEELWKDNISKSLDGSTLSVQNVGLAIHGTPVATIVGELHFSRVPKEEWQDAITHMKMSGITVISTYIFWIYHEEQEGTFDWSNNNDLRSFLQLCKEQEIAVILRIGPYCHGEVRNGGLPDWLYGRPFSVRSNDSGYLYYVDRLYQEIGKQAAEYLFQLGGPIIGVQLENEFRHASSPWEITVGQGTEYTGIGANDNTHLVRLKELARHYGLIAPIMTMTGWDSETPEDAELLPLLGGYAYKPWYEVQPVSDNYIFQDRQKGSAFPVAYCELMGGMLCWYNSRFIVLPKSVPAIAINALAGGSNFLGYYMFHGGINPMGQGGGFLNEYTTPKRDYDFQAPIGAYGQVRESAHRLRPIHACMRSFQKELIPLRPLIPEESAKDPEDRETLRYAARTDGRRGFIFLNNFQDHLELEDQRGWNLLLEGRENPQVRSLQEGTSCQSQNPYGQLRIPLEGTLNLAKDSSAILPFCLEMGGLQLRYSTTQPITYIDQGDTRTYFFFVVDGMNPEYCFEGILAGRVDYGEILIDFNESTHPDALHTRELVKPEEKKGLTRVKVSSTERSMIEFQTTSEESNATQSGLTTASSDTPCSTTSKRIRICTLTNNEATQFWTGQYKGRERVIISSQSILLRDGKLMVDIRGTDSATIELYPPVEQGETGPTAVEQLQGDTSRVDPKILTTHNEYLTTYEISLPPIKLESSSTIHGNKAQISVSPKDIVRVSKLWLEIAYRGDVGNALINGKLIYDNFSNGDIWEMELTRYKEQLVKSPLDLYIRPLQKGTYTMTLSEMAFQQKFEGEILAAIDRVTLVPQWRVVIDP